jgi:uncharacterized protein
MGNPMTETEFTPLLSLGGGLLIGSAAVLLMLLHGRVLGATGILSGAIWPGGSSRGWRVAFLAGAASAPALWLAATGGWPEITVPVGTPALVLGGVLVGVGVTLANGCTSGHGVCGMARGSRRSIAATLTFMAAALLTVFVIRHGGF